MGSDSTYSAPDSGDWDVDSKHSDATESKDKEPKVPDYEKLRLAKIAQNNTKLVELGLLDAQGNAVGTAGVLRGGKNVRHAG
jgi:hypothetical protein